MDLRLLRYFVAVANELHITRAAVKLGIQQAPLSHQIKLLEREIGFALFNRKPRGVELTEAGSALLLEGTEILKSVDKAIENTRQVARGQQGILRVGLTTSACFHPFPPKAVRAFKSNYPGVRIDFEQNSTPALLAQIRVKSIDVAIIRSATGNAPGVKIIPVLEEPMVAVLHKGHPLLKKRRPFVTLKALSNETFVGYPRSAGAGLYDAVIAACVSNGFHPFIGYEAPQIVSTLNMVASGLGVSIVPESMQRLKLDDIVYVRLAGAHRPIGQINIAVSSEVTTTSLANKFAGTSRDVLRANH